LFGQVRRGVGGNEQAAAFPALILGEGGREYLDTFPISKVLPSFEQKVGQDCDDLSASRIFGKKKKEWFSRLLPRQAKSTLPEGHKGFLEIPTMSRGKRSEGLSVRGKKEDEVVIDRG